MEQYTLPVINVINNISRKPPPAINEKVARKVSNEGTNWNDKTVRAVPEGIHSYKSLNIINTRMNMSDAIIILLFLRNLYNVIILSLSHFNTVNGEFIQVHCAKSHFICYPYMVYIFWITSKHQRCCCIHSDNISPGGLSGRKRRLSILRGDRYGLTYGTRQ